MKRMLCGRNTMNCPKCGYPLNGTSCEECGFDVKNGEIRCLETVNDALLASIEEYVQNYDALVLARNEYQSSATVSPKPSNNKSPSPDAKTKRNRIVLIGAILTAIICVSVIIISSYLSGDIWGPQYRPLFTWNTPAAAYPVFNSITDNPSIGDERNFVRVKEYGTDAYYDDNVYAVPGKEYEVYIYYHNNADLFWDTYATAKGVMLQVDMPERVLKGKTAVIKGSISSENTTPKKVWDSAFLTATEDIRFSVVPNSAVLHSFGETDGYLLDLNEVFSEGALFSPSINTPGEIPEESSGYITLRIKADLIN